MDQIDSDYYEGYSHGYHSGFDDGFDRGYRRAKLESEVMEPWVGKAQPSV